MGVTPWRNPFRPPRGGYGAATVYPSTTDGNNLSISYFCRLLCSWPRMYSLPPFVAAHQSNQPSCCLPRCRGRDNEQSRYHRTWTLMSSDVVACFETILLVSTDCSDLALHSSSVFIYQCDSPPSLSPDRSPVYFPCVLMPACIAPRQTTVSFSFLHTAAEIQIPHCGMYVCIACVDRICLAEDKRRRQTA